MNDNKQPEHKPEETPVRKDVVIRVQSMKIFGKTQKGGDTK